MMTMMMTQFGMKPKSTDEEFFQDALDEFPADSGARLLFAEWLAERGDERAPGARWLAQESAQPQDYRGSRTWDWNDELHFSELVGAIPHEMFESLKGGRLSLSSGYREYSDRRSAEEAFCQIFEPIEKN
jgi:uncharacterized protein (TIGR02996 family)